MGTKFSTRIWVSVVGIASIFFGSKGYADTVISVADFGLKPDTRENAVAYVQKAIEACRGKEPVTLGLNMLMRKIIMRPIPTMFFRSDWQCFSRGFTISLSTGTARSSSCTIEYNR